MKLKVKCLDLDAGGKAIAVMNYDDARELGVHPLERIIVHNGKKQITVLINVSHMFVKSGEIAVYDEVKKQLNLKNGRMVHASARPSLESKNYIRKKIDGKELSEREIFSIVNDITRRNLNDLEISSLVTALYINGITAKEDVYFTRAMIKTSEEQLKFSGNVLDKHSAGGVPGDKTSLLLVPIIAASGFIIPKTSSRAITDPAGTADRAEILMPVSLDTNQLVGVVKKTGGCIVWGGALKLSPVDDMIIQIEKPLSMDPFIVPSVLAKKKIVGSKMVVIDLPVGPETKFKNKKEAGKIIKRFMFVGKNLGLKIEYVITNGRQPLGYAIGPALEAREALQALINPRNAPEDVINKVLCVAGCLLKMAGSKQKAGEILYNGKAEKKLREIIDAQGGKKNIMPKDIPIEKNTIRASVKTDKPGKVLYISNRALVNIAKTAGAPADRYAGILLNKKLGDAVKNGEILYTIYAEKQVKLGFAKFLARKDCGYVIK